MSYELCIMNYKSCLPSLVEPDSVWLSLLSFLLKHSPEFVAQFVKSIHIYLAELFAGYPLIKAESVNRCPVCRVHSPHLHQVQALAALSSQFPVSLVWFLT